MTGSDENCRQRKKEGELCGCEWIICPVNVTEMHMRGPDFATVRALLHRRQPPSSGQYCSLRRGGSFLSRFLATGRMSNQRCRFLKLSQTNKHPYQIFSITASLHRKQGLAINGFTTRGYNRKRGHIKGNGFFVWVGWGGCVSERRSEKTAFVFTSPKFQNRPPLSSPYSSSCRLFCIFAFLIPLPSTCIDSSPLYVH